MKILRIPVDQYNNIDKLLQLEHYGDVLGLLDYRGRTQAAAYVLQKMVDNVSLFVCLHQREVDLTDEMEIFQIRFQKLVVFRDFSRTFFYERSKSIL